MIDDRIGEGTALTDFMHCPAFVVYASKNAAKHAVFGRSAIGCLRNGARVIYLPPGISDDARTAYEKGLGAALQ